MRGDPLHGISPIFVHIATTRAHAGVNAKLSRMSAWSPAALAWGKSAPAHVRHYPGVSRPVSRVLEDLYKV